MTPVRRVNRSRSPRLETLFDELGIKPMFAVVPDNLAQNWIA
jgi:hypothetical protein